MQLNESTLEFVGVSGDEKRYICPFCPSHGKSPDRVGHLYVNSKRGAYFCHRCGHRGWSDSLPVNDDIFNPVRKLEWGEVLERIRSSNMAQVSDFCVEDTDTIGNSYVPILPDYVAFEYLQKRGINEEQIKHYEIQLSSRDFFTRIHFPGRDLNGRLICSIARSYLAPSNPKYLNSKFARKEFVWNLDKVKNSDTIIVCEGPISAIRAGYNAVATLGKFVTKEQMLRISLMPNLKTIIVALDRDALRESQKVWKFFGVRGFTSKIVLWTSDVTGKDPAEVTKNQFESLLNKSVVYTGWNESSLIVS